MTELRRPLDVKRWTVAIPHFNDNPAAFYPGEGYTYPNNDMMPVGSAIRDRVRGVTSTAYTDTFGDIIVAATRLSMAIGKRVNVVHLGINAAGLAPVQGPNTYGFRGVLGWSDQHKHGTWAPSRPTSIYARLETLLRSSVENAMAAEGNTKTPKFCPHHVLREVPGHSRWRLERRPLLDLLQLLLPAPPRS